MTKTAKKLTRAELKARIQRAEARAERKAIQKKETRRLAREAKQAAARSAARRPSKPRAAPAPKGPIVTFDKDVGAFMRAQLTDAAKAVAEANGLNVSLTAPVIDEQFGDCMKITVVVRIPQFDADGREVPHRETAWMRYAHTCGLKTEWLGRRVVVGGQAYKIVGLDLRFKHTPVVIERDGKMYLESVHSLLATIRG